MARVTVEDCDHIANRFELVILAAQRAKQIASGAELSVPRDNDKDSVVSLREIAEQTIDVAKLREDITQSYCKRQVVERLTRSSGRDNSEIEELLAEEGELIEDSDEMEENFSAAIGKGELSFEGDNVDVED
jgi:DNA-directed RNA polymerase subunit omega